jgi:hypothetical protein
MSLRACFGVIQNCRVSHPCCVVPAAVPGGRREGRQALLAGRFLCSSATAGQPDPSTRPGPTAGCGRRGHVCGAARSCRRPGSPGAVLTRRGRSRRGGGGVPGRRWTGPRTPTHTRSRLAHAAPSTAGDRSRPPSSPRWAVTMAYGRTARRPAQPQAHDTKPRSSRSGPVRPRDCPRLLTAFAPRAGSDEAGHPGYRHHQPFPRSPAAITMPVIRWARRYRRSCRPARGRPGTRSSPHGRGGGSVKCDHGS